MFANRKWRPVNQAGATTPLKSNPSAFHSHQHESKAKVGSYVFGSRLKTLFQVRFVDGSNGGKEEAKSEYEEEPLIFSEDETKELSYHESDDDHQNLNLLHDSPKKQQRQNEAEKEVSMEDVYFLKCLELLESDQSGQNRLGWQFLMSLCTSELVNSKSEKSVALGLVFGNTNDISNNNSTNTKKDPNNIDRLRQNFLRYFQGKEDDPMVLPSLKVLESALQLASNNKKYLLASFDDFVVDLHTNFWKKTIAMISILLEDVPSRPLEAALAIKCIRLLMELEPKTMGTMVRCTLFPLLIDAQEFGQDNKYKMLERECDKLLGPHGILKT